MAAGPPPEKVTAAVDAVAGDPFPASARQRLPPHFFAPCFHESIWETDATVALIDAWSARQIFEKRNNLSHQQWENVADAVNGRYVAMGSEFRRTADQCKARMSALKQKYLKEKARVAKSNGSKISCWPYFKRLEAILDPASEPLPRNPPVNSIEQRTPSAAKQPGNFLSFVPASPASATETRPSLAQFSVTARDSNSRQSFSAIAAAAAAIVEQDREKETEDSEDSGPGSGCRARARSRSRSRDRGGNREGGCKDLMRAVERFADTYERVEIERQRQMIELEKQRMQFTKELELQRMQFTKDLEYQRMQLFMETLVQIRKINRSK